MPCLIVLLINSFFLGSLSYANDDICVESKSSIKDGVVIELEHPSVAFMRHTIVARSEELYKNTQCSMYIKIQKPEGRYNNYFQEFYGDVIEFTLRNVIEENQSCEYCANVVVGEDRSFMSLSSDNSEICNPLITYNDRVASDVHINETMEIEEQAPARDFPDQGTFQDPYPQGQDNILRYEHNGEPVFPEDSIPNAPSTDEQIEEVIPNIITPKKEKPSSMLLDEFIIRPNPFDQMQFQQRKRHKTDAFKLFCPQLN